MSAATATAATVPTTNHKYLEHLQRNCDTVSSGCTIINAFIEKINAPEDMKKINSPFGIQFKALINKPVLVRAQAKTKGQVPVTGKRKADGSMVNDNNEQGEEFLGGTIQPGEVVYANSFDRVNCLKLVDASIVKLVCSSSMYSSGNGSERVSYKIVRIIFDNNTDSLTKTMFDRSIRGTDLTVVPTKYNLLPKNFPGVTNEKYMSRRFVLPLHPDVTLFNNVEIVLDKHDRARFVCEKDGKEYVGFNITNGDKTSNALAVVYEPKSGPPILMKFAHDPSAWVAFGINDVALWKQVAYRIVSNVREAFVYGYSSLESIKNMQGNMDDYGGEYDDNGVAIVPSVEDLPEGQIINSTGYVTRIGVNLIETVKACGVVIDKSYVQQLFEDGSYNREYEPYGAAPGTSNKHPLNNNYRIQIKRGDRAIFNLSELNYEDVDKFFTACKDVDIKFFGIFDDGENRPYENEARGTGATVSTIEFINEHSIKPVVVFGIIGDGKK
jgi:hypothetical protein